MQPPILQKNLVCLAKLNLKNPVNNNMHVVVGELNDGNSGKLLFILIKHFSKILCDIGRSLGKLLDNKIHK